MIRVCSDSTGRSDPEDPGPDTKPGVHRVESGLYPMVADLRSLDNGVMDRLLTPPNGPRLVIVVVALIARAALGWVPLLGGLIGFVLLIVVLYQIAMIATNMIRSRPAAS